MRPLLDKDRVNRILLYPGSFNPPHHGHEALLNHAFANGHDMNIIAAIILPTDDDQLESKCAALGESLMLSKQERARLWKGWGEHDWAWVYDCSMFSWFSFQRRLTESVAHDGFDLQFVLLSGRDILNNLSLRIWNGWGCDVIMISDVSRRSNVVSDHSHWHSIRGCGPWEKTSRDGREVNQWLARTEAFYSGAIAILTREFQGNNWLY